MWLLHISARSTQIGQVHCQAGVLCSPNTGICGSPVNKRSIKIETQVQTGQNTEQIIIIPSVEANSFSIQMACERWL